MPIQRALLSVSDKSGLVAFARGLAALGTELIASGGTAQTLEQGGLAVRRVEEVTGFPEILEGRVKTLHPAVHGGILARRQCPNDLVDLKSHGISPIDVVVCNLYPFARTIASPGVSEPQALEQIDIGGVTLLRAAAKNYPWVIVLVDPADYASTLQALRLGPLSLEARRRLAAKAFAHTAASDAQIAGYLRAVEEPFPAELTLPLCRIQVLRYGENPQQEAAFYAEAGQARGISAARQLHGKQLSFNNILDADAAWAIASDFSEPTAVIVKHTNPCGLASAADLVSAYHMAYDCDPLSAFGGIVGFNRPVDEVTARAVARHHYDLVVAPGYGPEALAVLAKKRDLRLLETGNRKLEAGLDYRRVSGGMLIQTADEKTGESWRAVTRRAPSEKELAALQFAWRAVRHVKSNAIVLAQGQMLVGVGAGQMSRIDSVELALKKAGERAVGSVLASDGFFPMADGVQAAARGGVTAIVQPGGSVKDALVIAAADDAGLAMLFTGVRHFRH
ncbi:MAG: bifunctional phosphoribosylaminoimidazolecarboxamide formyltransferase/IMP cyclohydrolase [Chloroflexi bacterium]|nr:bifunctional phosphoribosylaminoimidazolecarboxamide formyltransferase/IMP cyclohydrolase [Chloroflexota bacterium]